MTTTIKHDHTNGLEATETNKSLQYTVVLVDRNQREIRLRHNYTQWADAAKFGGNEVFTGRACGFRIVTI
jgi:hypothetical protein